MAAPEREVGALGDAALPLPNIWLPELVERYANSLHPYDVTCTLRAVDKATAEQFRGRPQFASVRLSQPTPPQAFAARWAPPGAMRDLNLEQRKQLLRPTAVSGVVANLEVALEAVGWVPDWQQLSDLLKAAAAAGRADSVRGHSELADWLLQKQRLEGPIGPGDSLAPLSSRTVRQLPVVVWAVDVLGAAVRAAALAKAAAERCDLEVLTWLRQRGCPLKSEVVALAAAQNGQLPVLAWASEELGAQVQSAALMDAAAASGRVELMAWLRKRGCPWGADTLPKAIGSGCCEAALDWLAEQGCPMREDGAPYLAAARNNDLATLRCLARLDCPWGPASGPGAVFEMSLGPFNCRPIPVLRLLAELGFPMDWEHILEKSFRHGWDVPKWVREWLAAAVAQWQQRQQPCPEARKAV
ncbi:hypothetical protein GPECTOR_81g204 [Gonium pectorale]|uniref:Ankyrin repeat domain-containing protein n=1 Tax=Gonium pectorale TaxID=33097 RepID=A0A150G1Q8_GONPE|nr:hypothetical protein GPECTOR_81g204 [Gonium pectorale]|eukprot:KXZ43754.1 hypothetical protein GPECTOR_81g204 [Gonium pectorale]